MDSTNTKPGHRVRIAGRFDPMSAAKTNGALALAFDALIVLLLSTGWLWITVDLITDLMQTASR